jgi:N-acetylglucosaminyldiphosphoundecaprenol N-acetyl-beta-D-mannosaminyltransferase
MNASSTQLQILGVQFDNLTIAEAADRIEDFIRAGVPRRILTRNAGIRVMEEHHAALRRIYETSDLVTVDGMAFVRLGRFLGCPFKEMTGGPFLWYEVLQRAARNGYGVFLLGARAEVLQRAVQRLPLRFPGLNIVGYHNGYFTTAQDMQVVEEIRRSHPDILMVGMSSPLQEEFIERNLHQLGVPACIGVGGAIDLFAGFVRLAPVWMRRACLEWLYRVWQEPQRLGKRYLVSNARFLIMVARELKLHRAGDPHKAQVRAEGGR